MVLCTCSSKLITSFHLVLLLTQKDYELFLCTSFLNTPRGRGDCDTGSHALLLDEGRLRDLGGKCCKFEAILSALVSLVNPSVDVPDHADPVFLISLVLVRQLLDCSAINLGRRPSKGDGRDAAADAFGRSCKLLLALPLSLTYQHRIAAMYKSRGREGLTRLDRRDGQNPSPTSTRVYLKLSRRGSLSSHYKQELKPILNVAPEILHYTYTQLTHLSHVSFLLTQRHKVSLLPFHHGHVHTRMPTHTHVCVYLYTHTYTRML